jgi:DNA invertase Pin-like site-specific DNA recombinase
MADAHRRRCDTVLVWKIDRLGRPLKHLLYSRALRQGHRGRLILHMQKMMNRNTESVVYYPKFAFVTQ